MIEKTRELAISVVEKLRHEGFQALFAGGCVRDLLLGETPTDFDVATNATPEVVMKLFRRTVPVGVSFGVVRVLGNKDQGEIEVATFRTDGEYVDGRRPESVRFATAEADAQRRDFTINGMFFDPIADEVIDYVGGKQDLDQRVIRAIGIAKDRFSEDKLRLLRAVRFAARLGFEIESETAEAIRGMACQVTTVSVERIADEWRKMLVHTSRARAITLARELGLLAAILPSLEIASQADDDTWTETLGVLDALPKKPSFALAMAALLRGLEPVAEIDAILEHWKLSNADRERIVWLLERKSALVNAQSLKRSTLKRLLSSEGLDELLRLHAAISLATTGDISHVAYCEKYCVDLPDGPLNPPPLVTGRDLIEAGLKPGPEFSRWLERIRDAQLDGDVTTKHEALSLICAL